MFPCCLLRIPPGPISRQFIARKFGRAIFCHRADREDLSAVADGANRTSAPRRSASRIPANGALRRRSHFCSIRTRPDEQRRKSHRRASFLLVSTRPRCKRSPHLCGSFSLSFAAGLRMRPREFEPARFGWCAVRKNPATLSCRGRVRFCAAERTCAG